MASQAASNVTATAQQIIPPPMVASTCPRRCDDWCQRLAVRSPIERDDRPPMVPCPHCGAMAGVACTVVGSRRRQYLRTFGPSHPSRLEAVA